MSEVNAHGDAQLRTSSIFLIIGGLMLALGIYMGYAKASEILIIIFLLGSVVLFTITATPYLKLVKVSFFGKSEAPPSVPKVEPQPEAKAAQKPEEKTEIKAETKVKIQPDPGVEVKPDAALEMKPATSIEAFPVTAIAPATEVKAEALTPVKMDNREAVAKLMSTPLGELLLAGLIKDPQSAGRFVAQAISEAEKSQP